MSVFDDVLASLGDVVVPPLPGGDHTDPFVKTDPVFLWDSPDALSVQHAFIAQMAASYEPAMNQFKTEYFKTYTRGGKFVWTKSKPTAQHYDCMIDILLMFFSIWVSNGVGYIDEYDEWISTSLYRYHTYSGITPEIRSSAFFCFVTPYNSSVYVELKTITIAHCINSFFRLIDVLGFYRKSSVLYFAPQCSEPRLMSLFTKALCSFPYIPKFPEYGMLEIPVQSWETFAVGPYNIDCPNPVRDWSDIPQILRLEPTEPPNNDVNRYFPLTPERLDKFDECLDTCNKLMYTYAKEQRFKPKSDTRLWYSRVVTALIHKYAPNLTCLIGTQLMQRVAREHITHVEPGDTRPAPYVPEYLHHIDSDELEAFTHYVYGLSSVLHSYITGILALVGAAGCGKTTLTDMLCMLVGGLSRVSILDEYNGPFSSSLLRSNGPGLVIIEDGENEPACIPKSFLANFTGTHRTNTKRSHTRRQKHEPEVTETAMPKSAVLSCNYPPVIDNDGTDVNRIIRAIISKAGDGMLRRVYVNLPGTSATAGGTCGRAPFTFNMDAIIEREHDECEGAFLRVLFVAIGIIGNDLAHPETGFISHTNELASTLFKDWIERSKDPSGHCTKVAHNLVMPSIPHLFGTPTGTLRIFQGVPIDVLTAAYFNKTRSVLTHAPHNPQFFMAPCTNCKYCNIVYTGADLTVAGIDDFYSHCSQVDRDFIKRDCPMNPTVKCYQSLRNESLYSGWQLRPDN